MTKMPEFSQGQLNDPERKRVFGSNVTIVLHLLNRSTASLAIRTDISEDSIKLILAGRHSLTNETIGAIVSELYLTVNDFMNDYGSGAVQNEQLQRKLQLLGKLPDPDEAVAIEVTDTKSAPRTIPVARPDAKRGLDIEGGLKALGKRGKALRESPKMIQLIANIAEDKMAQKDIWNEDDDIASIDGKVFRLRDKDVRITIGKNIKRLRKEKFPDDQWPEFLVRAGIKKRQDNWIHNVGYGNGKITGTEVESFAELFEVSVLSLLTCDSSKDADQAPVSPEPVAAVAAPAAEEPVVQNNENDTSIESEPAATYDDTEVEAGELVAQIDKDNALYQAMQNHFKQLVLAESVELLDNATLVALFRASHTEDVDWSNIYLTLTAGGAEVVASLTRLQVCLKNNDPDLRKFIKHILFDGL